MKKNMITATAVFLLAAVIFKITYDVTGIPAFYSMMATFGTVFYHFGMRLAVGGIINARFHNNMNYRREWFREKHFEKSLYKKLRVKKWKDRVPMGRQCSSFFDYILRSMSSGSHICDCAEIQPSETAPPDPLNYLIPPGFSF